MKNALRFTWIAVFLLFAAIGQLDAPPAVSASEGASVLDSIGKEIATIVEKTRPAVVQIYSTKMVKGGQWDPFEGFDEFFNQHRRSPRGRVREFPVQGLGSGFFISSDGVILTNSHVVADSDDLEVVLDNGKKYKATLKGSDPLSEVAVIQIDEKNLPCLEPGDSENLNVGTFVIAIGSPQGLSQSVTLGIVSAVKRSQLGITTFGSYIQTDAAINQGNSGGPLLNAQGKVIGINTAIISTSGGSQGLGLAFPIHEALSVAKMIREEGKVSRGYLGVWMQELEPEMADYFGAAGQAGAVVTQLIPDSPAVGQLKADDIITGINGKPVSNTVDVMNRIAAMRPGKKVELNILRDGKKKDVTVELGTRPGPEKLVASGGGRGEPGEKAEAENLDLGFSVETLTPEKAQGLGLKDDEKGLLVTQVEPSSEAYKRGLRAAMLIVQVNRQDVDSIAGVKEALQAGKRKPGVLLRVKTPEGSRLIVVPKQEK